MRFFLGIDGGASKTQVWLSDEAGNIVGQGLAGPTNLAAVSKEVAAANLKDGCEQVRLQAKDILPEDGTIERAVMGLSGFDTPAEQQNAQHVFEPVFEAARVTYWTIVNDCLNGLRSGTDYENAIVLIAGTGTNCFGRNDLNQITHNSGLDILLSDQGSGYDIGSHVLKAAVKSYDGRSIKSSLETAVCQFFGVAKVMDLKAKLYYPILDKRQIATLAPLAFAAKKQGDKIATEIVEYAVNELFIMVEVAVKNLGFEKKLFDLVLVGSLWNEPMLQEMLKEKINKIATNVRIILPTLPPVAGAVKMAIEAQKKQT